MKLFEMQAAPSIRAEVTSAAVLVASHFGFRTNLVRNFPAEFLEPAQGQKVHLRSPAAEETGDGTAQNSLEEGCTRGAASRLEALPFRRSQLSKPSIGAANWMNEKE